MKAKIPKKWEEKTYIEYSFRFYSYDNINDGSNYNERWWSVTKNTIAWTACEGDINLDIKMIIRFAKGHRVTFNKLLSDCISHEMIHCILTRDIDDNASHLFENICSKKSFNLKEWFGGMA